ncbi:hypothetical protein [Alkalimarinus coralli]|uniref:hypothetical protein n=1 Tax=Alkalimarinus coralli TaxID=2935863 RepID=UPI00202B6A27|nr:hypothetical protein [Alkalimarinus coralli]
MIFKHISSIANSIFYPVALEVQKAQQASLEKLRNAFAKAEEDVAVDVDSMSAEQRLLAADQELERAQEQMLSAVTSLFKSLLYLSPSVGLLLDKSTAYGRVSPNDRGEFINKRFARNGKVEKEVRGEVVG